MPRPRRISIGQYAVYPNGREIILRRVGRSGFRPILRQGAKSPLFRRLRDAAAYAIEMASPWPFTVEKKVDLAADIPWFLDRRSA